MATVGPGEGAGGTPGSTLAEAGAGASDAAPVGTGTSSWRRWARAVRRRMGTPDGRAVLVLVVVPAVVFAVPALAGHPAIAQDNLLQNFPLRVLVGDSLRQGHLPLWNPFIWSGSPLLGGLNAGAAYPLTLLFVVLPPVVAWTLVITAVYWSSALGTYALARQYGLAPLPCLLAALTYTFGGAMVGQMAHLGVVQGMGWMPVMVLALVRLSWATMGTRPVLGDGAPGRSPALGWVVLLALTFAFIVLTGEPRAMAEAEVVAAAVVVWLGLRPYAGTAIGLARRARFVVLAAAAGLWGVLLAAVQILPGWEFISASQRATESYAFFGAGSLRPSWSALLFVPDLFGGSGFLHQPAWFTSYNMPEVTGYVGLLPLVAFAALALRSFGRRRDPQASDWGMWLGLAVLGLLLAWGSFTPLGHLFVHIPLFGKTRLQSRNLGIVDLALAVLLGFWVDRVLRLPRGAPVEGGCRRWLVLMGPAVAGVLCVVGIAAPAHLEAHFGASPSGGRGLWQSFLAQLVLVVGVVVVVAGWRRLDRRRRRRWLSVLVVCDLVFFMAVASTDLDSGRATPEPSPAAAAALFGTQGRFAIDTSGATLDMLSAVGQPDLNAFTQLPSVQGYGSIVAGDYTTATGTHTLDTMSTCALEAGAFADLRLSTLLTQPSELAPGLGALGQLPAPPPACPGAARPGSAHERRFYFGWTVPVSSASFGRLPDVHVKHARLVVGVIKLDGRIAWPAERVTRTVTGGWAVQFAQPAPAVGFVLRGPVRAVSDDSTFTNGLGGFGWALDGSIQDAMDSSTWHYTRVWKGFVLFKAAHVAPAAWLAGSPHGASVHVVATSEWGTEVDDVTARRAVTLVRSEADAPGWHATLQPVGGGPTRTAAVRSVGLVQSVRVPPGRWTVTFLYRPRTLNLGLAGSAAGLAALVGVGVWAARRRRAAVRRPGPAAAAR